MTRILDRYVYKELGAPFLIGVGVFTFFLVIDRLYQLTALVITKSVPFALVLPLLIYVARLREGGHRVTRYVVQLYSKLSFPLVHVIMAVFAGIGTALFLSART
jgi:lipopolysaccharide export LptBFGC system permease protein LptF